MKALAFSLAVTLLVVGRCQGGAIPGQTGSQSGSSQGNAGGQSGQSGSPQDRPGGGNASVESCGKKICLLDF